jgi:hypothetical protein
MIITVTAAAMAGPDTAQRRAVDPRRLPRSIVAYLLLIASALRRMPGTVPDN